MSPAVNVALEEVPFAILEAVKARILANRAKLERERSRSRPSTRPRPQYRKQGASSRRWKRPERAAVPFNQSYTFAHAVNSYALTGGTSSQPIAVYNGYIYPSPRPQTNDPLIFSATTGFDIDWTVKSGNRAASVSGSVTTPTVTLPTGEIAYSEEVQQETGTATIVEQLIEVRRVGTANNQPFTQVLGTFTYTAATFQPSVPAEDLSNVYSQIGGPWPSYNDARAPVIAAAPPPPPGHTYSIIEDVQLSSTSTEEAFSFPNRYVYAYNWNTQAVSFWRTPQANSTFVIPVGDDVCILVLMSRYAHALTVESFSGTLQSSTQLSRLWRVPLPSPLPPSTATPTTYSSVINKAYLCSTATVRELQIPQKLNEILQIINPPFNTASLPGGTSITSVEGDDGFYSGSVSVWTPAVFAALNAIHQFVDPELIQSFPADIEPALTDNREGFYANSSENQSHYYAVWTGDPSNVDLEQTEFFDRIDDATLEIADNIDAYADNLSPVWDWDDPNYCQAMCKALGFSDADLTP